MVHDRLAGGEVNRQLGRELEKSLGLSRAEVLASVNDAIGLICRRLSLKAGDAVILSPLAPPYWLPALESRGLRPLFCDVLADSPVLDPTGIAVLLEEQPKALVADCCLGYLPDYTLLKSFGVPVVEDFSQGMGGVWSNGVSGAWGDAVLAVFSPESLVAGTGGCLAGFRGQEPQGWQGASPWEALSDLGSALILSQWKDSALFVERKKEHFRHLFHRLPRHYRLPKQDGDAQAVHPWFPVMVDSGAKDVLAYARKKAVEADWAFRDLPAFHADQPPEFCPKARSFLYRTLIFPLYATISLKEIDLLGKVISSLP